MLQEPSPPQTCMVCLHLSLMFDMMLGYLCTMTVFMFMYLSAVNVFKSQTRQFPVSFVLGETSYVTSIQPLSE